MDLTTAAAIIAALGGSAGLAALVKAINDGKHTAKQTDLSAQQIQIDNLVKTINEVQDENDRLRRAQTDSDAKNREVIAALHAEYKQRQDALEKEIDSWREKYYKQECTIDDMQAKITSLERSNGILRRELKKAQHNIAELVVENEELKKAMGGEPEGDA